MVDAYIKRAKAYFREAHESRDTKLCFWVYYAGHGVMNNMNYIVLNERNNPDRFYPLESVVWIYTDRHKNTSAFIFFDSCREAITRE